VKVLLLQLDGKMPNLALMRLAAHHRARGDEVTLERAPNRGSLKKARWAGDLKGGYDLVYGSLIFERTRELAEKVREVYPEVVLGGTGWSMDTTLEDVGVLTKKQDYSIYPEFEHSIGFTQRGCRLKCPFCVVPKKEGKNVHEHAVHELWRGEGHPKNLLLLDNDYFGQEGWREKTEAMITGGFKVCFSQGLNVRLFDREAAEYLARLDCRDDQFRRRRVYCAWDNKKDEQRLFAGLDLLTQYGGFNPDQIMVFMLIGYWPGETQEDRLYRQRKLREYGCRPYPMPYVRTPELVGFQRWCISSCDKRVPWDVWEAAKYQPRNLPRKTTS
jgi:hypothetical protein